MSRSASDPLRPLFDEERNVLQRVSRATSEARNRHQRAIALLAVAEGKSLREAARLAGWKSHDPVTRLTRRFNTMGLSALDDLPRSGHPHTYGEAEKARILQEANRTPDRLEDATGTWSLTLLQRALRAAPADGGLWDGPKVAAWMAERLGRQVDPRRGWDYLQRLGRSTRVPRPQHEESDEAEQAAFKKLPEEVDKLRQASPEATIELWSQDEHRVGLKPILRRVWARKGTRVQAVVRPRYQWMYLSGFVQPESGKTSWLLLPTVNTQVFSLALATFAQEQGAGPNKQLLLVLDQAGWHKSAALQLPEGLHLLFFECSTLTLRIFFDFTACKK